MFNIHSRRSDGQAIATSPKKIMQRANSKASVMSSSGIRRPSADDHRFHVTAEPGQLLQQVNPHAGEINRYPGISAQSSTSPSGAHDFGVPRSPFPAAAAAGHSPIDNDAMSIRTISSVNSGRRDPGPNRERDRYPSFTMDPITPTISNRQVPLPSPDPRPSSRMSSRTSQQSVPIASAAAPPPRPAPSTYTPSIMSLSSNRRVSEEINFSRPPDAEVERLFRILLETRNIDDSTNRMPALSSRASVSSQSNIAKTAAALPVDIKWQMVESDARARHDAAKANQKKEEEMSKQGKASKRGTAGAVVKNSPQWFLKMVLDGSLTTQQVSTLAVSLRTQPLEWVWKNVIVIITNNQLARRVHGVPRSGRLVQLSHRYHHEAC